MAKDLCLPDVTKNDVETQHSTMEFFSMKEYSAQEWLPSASGLGESPLYRSSDNTFFFVDIKSPLAQRYRNQRDRLNRISMSSNSPSQDWKLSPSVWMFLLCR